MWSNTVSSYLLVVIIVYLNVNRNQSSTASVLFSYQSLQQTTCSKYPHDSLLPLPLLPIFTQASVILFTGGWQTPPKRQTPPSRADTPLPSTCWDTPPSTATAADGTHPTGMHSCYFYLLTQVSMRCKMKIKISRNICCVFNKSFRK